MHQIYEHIKDMGLSVFTGITEYFKAFPAGDQ
jgi:hypothetical protein